MYPDEVTVAVAQAIVEGAGLAFIDGLDPRLAHAGEVVRVRVRLQEVRLHPCRKLVTQQVGRLRRNVGEGFLRRRELPGHDLDAFHQKAEALLAQAQDSGGLLLGAAMLGDAAHQAQQRTR